MNRPDTSHRSFSADRLQAALHDVGGVARPDYLTDIVTHASRTRQRPAWTFLERWLPMDIGVRRLGVTRTAAVFAMLVLLVGLLAAAVAFVGSQRSQQERPLVLPGTQTFNSSIHAISIEVPSGWVSWPATEPWQGRAIAFGSPQVDVISHPTLQDDLYFAIVSEPLDGESPAEWCCTLPLLGLDMCYAGGGGGHGGGTYRVDGAEEGFASTMSCGVGGGRHTLVAATATRGYVIQLWFLDDRLEGTYDWDWFKAFLETVELDREDAP